MGPQKQQQQQKKKKEEEDEEAKEPHLLLYQSAPLSSVLLERVQYHEYPCFLEGRQETRFCLLISWCHLKGMSRYLTQNYYRVRSQSQVTLPKNI